MRDRPNIVVYVADALRVDYVGSYGSFNARTPRLDQFATGGAKFEQAIASAPWTCPSTTSMITGLHPHHHGFLHWDAELDPGLPTLFTVATSQGYTTASFVFDENYLFKGFEDANVIGRSDEVDEAVAWMGDHKEEPFCLWFHSWATHMPYDVDHADRGAWLAAKEQIIDGIQSGDPAKLEELKAAYKRAVEMQSGYYFSSFMVGLEELGLLEDTVVVFLADHGESWGERFEDKTEVKGTYHMHGANLYEEIVRVPFMISAPGRIRPDTLVMSQVSLVDLMPTLADFMGVPIPGLDGESLMPLIVSAEDDAPRALGAPPVTAEVRPAIIVGTDKGAVSQIAVRDYPWKLIHHLESGEDEAYDVRADPGEVENLADVAPEELRELLQAEVGTVSRERLSAEEEALVEGRLRDLGYL